MKYAKTSYGDRWHPLDRDGVSFCGVAGFLFFADSASDPVSAEDRCENCDSALRELGRQFVREKRQSRKKVEKTDDYEPKNRARWT